MQHQELLSLLHEAVQQRDYASAASLLIESRREGSATAFPLLFSLVAAQVAAFPEAVRRERVRQFIDDLACDPSGLPPADALQMADLYLLAGLRQEASELCHKLLEQHPTFIPASHRLGLCELSRAITSPRRNARVVVQRWRRAIAYLSLAIADDTYFQRWAEERFLTYGVEFSETALDHADSRIVKRLRALISHQAALAENEDAHDTAGGLRALAVELDVDQSATKALAAAVSVLGLEPRIDTPTSFGPLWMEAMDSPLNARELLGDVIRHSAFLPRQSGSDAVDQFAPTHGSNIRQWYSRLAPIRHSLRWGHLETAERELSEICGKQAGCEVNRRPALLQLAGSPKCCSPACPSFAICNPGYSSLADPARDMEIDAHRIAIYVHLALAQQHALASPPRFLEAAQQWVRGRTLARVVEDSEQFEEDVAAQVMSLLEHHRSRPEQATELLDRALAAVPGPSIRGRFADLLMDRGIERCNAGRWPEGARDLRWALRLNPYSERAHRNLGMALQNLAVYYFNANNVRQAYSAAQELNDLADAALRGNRQQEEFQPLLDWARVHLQAWDSLRDRDGDAQLNALIRQLTQRLND